MKRWGWSDGYLSWMTKGELKIEGEQLCRDITCPDWPIRQQATVRSVIPSMHIAYGESAVNKRHSILCYKKNTQKDFQN